MTRHNLIAILVIAILAMASSLFAQQVIVTKRGRVNVPDAVYVAGKSLVDVTARGAGGSGTVLDMGYRGPQSEHKHIHVATNHHVIASGPPFTIEFQGSNKKFPATLIGSDRGADIAFLKVERTTEAHRLARPCVIRNDEVQIGETLFWGGYSYRGPLLFAAEVRERKTFGGDTMLADGYSVSGMSGGGCFDSKGRWVSPLWGYVGNQEQNCIVEPSLMKRLLVSKYGYTPLRIDKAAAPINFPQTLPYGREYKNDPNNLRNINLEINTPPQQVLPQQILPQQVLPYLIQQQPQQVLPRTGPVPIWNGAIPFKLYAEFDWSGLNVQVGPQFRVGPEIPQPAQPQIIQPQVVPPQVIPQPMPQQVQPIVPVQPRLQAPQPQQPLGCYGYQ